MDFLFGTSENPRMRYLARDRLFLYWISEPSGDMCKRKWASSAFYSSTIKFFIMKRDLESLQSLVTILVTHFNQWPTELTTDVFMEMMAKAAHHPSVKEWDPVKWENATDTLLEVVRLHQSLKHHLWEHHPDEMRVFNPHLIT